MLIQKHEIVRFRTGWLGVAFLLGMNAWAAAVKFCMSVQLALANASAFLSIVMAVALSLHCQDTSVAMAVAWGLIGISSEAFDAANKHRGSENEGGLVASQNSIDTKVGVGEKHQNLIESAGLSEQSSDCHSHALDQTALDAFAIVSAASTVLIVAFIVLKQALHCLRSREDANVGVPRRADAERAPHPSRFQ
jgi:hypothetical protein